MNMITPISVLIPTFNEEIHIKQCIESVAGWTDEIWIVDSFSTDKTKAIAESLGARCVEHIFEGFARQKNWALENIPFKNDWVLILDADERVSADLKNEIEEMFASSQPKKDGFYINRRVFFYGKWIRHCGWYPSWNLRLFKHTLGRYEDRPVDEHLILNGEAGHCKNDLLHEDLRDIGFWIAKHNRYSDYNALIYNQRKSTGFTSNVFGNQAERKRFIKENIWAHLPGRALIYFFYLYVLRLGFLDGAHGLRFCVMRGIFEHFNTIKLWELRNYKEGAAPGAIRVSRSSDKSSQRAQGA